MFNAYVVAKRFMEGYRNGEGGGTEYREGAMPGRYVVGGLVPSVVILEDYMSVSVCVEAVNVLLSHEQANGADTIGFWVHDGKVYFDLSSVVDDREVAIELGRARGELAVFDSELMEDIAVDVVGVSV